MTNIDQFESVFKAAAKTPFEFEPIRIEQVLVVTDLDGSGSVAYAEDLRRFLSVLDDPAPDFQVCAVEDYRDVDQLLRRVKNDQPELICTYRNLRSPAHDHPYSLGSYVDVLTQATTAAVLLTPYPGSNSNLGQSATRNVMVVTDHLAGDHHLVNVGRHFTRKGGRLILSHVEDEQVFERYLTVIGKIPSIDTDNARDTIREQLLKEPADYVGSCREALRTLDTELVVESHVEMGHWLKDYRRLIDEHHVDLLVMNTKDEDQLAMHGVAHPLSVELRRTPLLLL